MANKGTMSLRTPDEVEAVYYECFQRCDAVVMAALWAKGNVVCVHPGSAAILGYDAVIRSWEHIFSNARMPKIHVELLKRTVGHDIAVHVVTERIGDGEDSALVLATNVYQKFTEGWLMIEHHGSLVQFQQQGRTLQ